MHKETTAGYESEIKRLDSAKSELTAHLEIEKEKLHTLEAAFEQMRKQGKTASKTRKKTNTSTKHKIALSFVFARVLIVKENCCHINFPDLKIPPVFSLVTTNLKKKTQLNIS